MKTDAFDYNLPEECIAQSPALPRESCKMLVLHRASGAVEHRRFTDVLKYLNEGDLLIVNDTKVMPARLLGKKVHTEAAAEVLLLHRSPAYDEDNDDHSQHWVALVKPGRRLKPGSHIQFGTSLNAEVVDWGEPASKGQRLICLTTQGDHRVTEAIEELGKLPLPPYIKDYVSDTSMYQTVYAREQNSSAAPTAGLHFSEELLMSTRQMGVEVAPVCLEIGLDTFRKVEEEDIEDHHIHRETYTVSEDTVQAVARTKERGGRVIAVGTTAVRALESAAYETGALRTVAREQTSLYITPGYEYRVVDALITNFHTPRSTLLMLVSAFTGYEALFNAYEQALKEHYRFLSFGDAMIIL